MADILDVDAWLDGAEKPEERVIIYQRPNLASKLDELERELEIELDGDDESLGNARADALKSEIAEVYGKLVDSEGTIVVTSLSRDEIDELGLKARDTAREAADKAANDARKMMAEQITREGVKDAKEKTELLRRASREASASVIAQETSLHVLAAAITEPKMTRDQVKRLGDKIGDGQLQKIMAAFNRVSSDAPKVTAPKSLRPGIGAEDAGL